MQNETQNNNTPEELHKAKRLGVIFLIIGIITLAIIGSLIIASKNNESKMDAQTTSTSVSINEKRDDDGDMMYRPIYTYEVDGQTYTCETSFSSSIHPSENNATIYYESSNPSNCASDYSRTGEKFFYLFLILPAVFIIVGISSIKAASSKLEHGAFLKDSTTPSQQPPTPPSSSSTGTSQGYDLS